MSISKPMELHTVFYRFQQVRQQLGFVAPLSAEQQAEVAQWLPTAAALLFRTMSNADQQHSLRVCRGLQTIGCTEEDMLAAALLHDIGKAQRRVPFWTRPTIVIGKKLAPRLLTRLVVYPAKEQIMPRWQRSLSYAWYHAEVGAELAAQVGLSERAVLYIRTHHQPDGPAALLHKVDEVS
ncbi:MAG: HDOD domain-containing protein [Chloroflexota bacterium]|nr:HDOD domain-containing protein [Chloroflexota bacterium]